MKKVLFLIVSVLILALVLTGCSLLSNIGQAPTNEQSGVSYLTKGLSSGLVGWWRFNGDATDSSGNGNDGTVYGEGDYDISPMGQALSFDGEGDYVQLPASDAILNVNTFTIEAWFKTDVNHPAYGVSPYEGRLVNLHWKDTESTAVSLYVEKDKIGLLYNTGNMAHVWVKYIVNYHDNFWHHIAVTYDATTYRLYYDGEEVASKVDAFGGFGTYSAFLGAYISSERFFNGTIDEVRIWDVALPQDQLGKIYNFGGILPPIKADGSSVFKLGRTIPVKFQLWDDQDNFITDAVANIFVKKLNNGTSGDEMDAVSTAAATTGNLFRYDSSSNQYIFNLSTKLPFNGVESWSAGTWEIRIELDDGMSYYENIVLKP